MRVPLFIPIPGHRRPVKLARRDYDLLSAYLRATNGPALHERDGLARLLPKIAGGTQVLFTNPTNPAAIGAATTILGPIPTGQIPVNPLVLALSWVPNNTGVTAAATATYTHRRTDTPAVIGSAILTNTGAGAAAVGPALCLSVVPAGIAAASGVDVQVAASAGTVQPVFNTTGAPAFLALLGLI